eukprot:9103948-Pyramimonas_sp.AAC.1
MGEALRLTQTLRRWAAPGDQIRPNKQIVQKSRWPLPQGGRGAATASAGRNLGATHRSVNRELS